MKPQHLSPKQNYIIFFIKAHFCYLSYIMWMALFSWVLIFVYLRKIKHLWGSKFVAIVFFFKIHT